LIGRKNQKQDILKKAQAAVKEAGYEDILIVDRDKFAVVKNRAKVYFRPLKREGNTRRYQEAKRNIEGIADNSVCRNGFGMKQKMVFIHPHMLMDLEKRDQ
jgi:hypothetical protein